jgi:hypothetical protein
MVDPSRTRPFVNMMLDDRGAVNGMRRTVSLYSTIAMAASRAWTQPGKYATTLVSIPLSSERLSESLHHWPSVVFLPTRGSVSGEAEVLATTQW